MPHRKIDNAAPGRWLLPVILWCALGIGCGTGEYDQLIEAAIRAPRGDAGGDAPAADETVESPARSRRPGGAGQVIGGRQSALGQVLNAAIRTGAINKARNVAQAMIAYESQNRRYPAQAIVDPNGQPLLSWRVEILQTLDRNFYRRFHLDEPWDSPHNSTLIDTMPADYDVGYRLEPGYTALLAVVGPDTVFPPGDQPSQNRDIRDGASNTVLVVIGSSDAAVPWTKPQDIELDDTDPTKGIVSGDGTFIAAFCDGRVQRITNNDPDRVRAIMTRSGGEPVPSGDL